MFEIYTIFMPVYTANVFRFSTGYASNKGSPYIIMRINKVLRHEETARERAVYKLSLSEGTHNKTHCCRAAKYYSGLEKIVDPPTTLNCSISSVRLWMPSLP